MLEPYIKKKLITKLAPPKADIYKELFFGDAIADVAFLETQKFTGFEIKSDGDKLDRFIASQQLHYPFMFDECWLVVTKKHLDKAAAEIETSVFFGQNSPWGLMDTNFKVIIPAKDTKDCWVRQTNGDAWLLNRLWKEDLVTECKKRKCTRISRLNCCELRNLLATKVKPEEIRPLVKKYTKLHKEIQSQKLR